MDKATPRPWKKSKNNYQGIKILGSNNKLLAFLQISRLVQVKDTEEIKANAELIVRAVNFHDELVEALEMCLKVSPTESVRLNLNIKSILKKIRM